MAARDVLVAHVGERFARQLDRVLEPTVEILRGGEPYARHGQPTLARRQNPDQLVGDGFARVAVDDFALAVVQRYRGAPDRLFDDRAVLAYTPLDAVVDRALAIATAAHFCFPPLPPGSRLVRIATSRRVCSLSVSSTRPTSRLTRSSRFSSEPRRSSIRSKRRS